MFESAEIGHRLDPAAYRQALPGLRRDLLDAQYALLGQPAKALLILVHGVDGAGKGETVNLLNEWMDPRYLRTEALEAGERDGRPDVWRFWQVLPPKGHVGILFGSWYTDPIADHVAGRDNEDRFAHRLERIRQFERMLVAEGVVLLKLWFHLSRKATRERFKALQADERTAWRVTARDVRGLRHFDARVRVAGEALRRTSSGEAPWHVIDGTDPCWRSLTTGRLVLDALRGCREPLPAPAPGVPLAAGHGGAPSGLLASLDYGQHLGRKHYEARLEELQGRLNGLMRHLGSRRRSLVVVFEGMDAAGKGGSLRRVVRAMDARQYRVVPVAAPNENERAQPYLWRFWRYIPRLGHATLFDRSWYGRVLVERVEALCAEADWRRAYAEINEFEEQLVEAGAVVVKFWLAITPAEQLRRFEHRGETPHKAHKITAEDWRNRERWPDYERAVEEMIDRTSTLIAPWHVVASDNKLWTRVEVLRILCERLEAALRD